MDTKPTYTTQLPPGKKQPNTALKVIVLMLLIILLVIGILLPIKLVPNAVTSLKNTFSSFFNSQKTVVENTPTPVSPTSTSTPVVQQPIATTTPVITSTPTKPVTYSPQPSNPQGNADLSVRIVDVGYLTNNGVFVSSHSVTSSQRAAVKFSVTNVGNKNTGTWSFKANLPTPSTPVYVAKNQSNLAPQQGIIYTLGFEPINPVRVNTITITADPSGLIRESSEANNTTSVTIINPEGSYIGGVTPSSKPDLIVRSIKTAVASDNQVTVTIEVGNQGSVVSGPWKFTADLPTSGENTFYRSPVQNSIAVGGTMILTLIFTAEEDYGNKIIIDVDSSDSINESNEYNNTKTATVNLY